MKVTGNMDNSSDQSQIIKMFQLTCSRPNQVVTRMPGSKNVDAYLEAIGFLVNNQIGAQFFLVCLFLFSTCFGQPCAHHQENYCISATPGLFH